MKQLQNSAERTILTNQNQSYNQDINHQLIPEAVFDTESKENNQKILNINQMDSLYRESNLFTVKL